ncbi:MAG TPA: (d)CMP kinase [Bacteroidia bacterium]|jgi:cytidylate kinase|nr:(d)CMP kinase [Bacteroidia bacterium]
MKDIIIAIDGYSSCGKSTITRDLANALGYVYVDTGAMYRAVTLYCLEKGIIQESRAVDAGKVIRELLNIHIDFKHSIETGKTETYLNGKNVENDIRSMAVNELVSPVSAIHEVRKVMVYLQRKMGANPGIVMDGRDIGTTVLPHADLKIFMTADIKVRTQRRMLELKERGIKAKEQEVERNLLKRDQEDMNREESPLKQAPDAVVLDNTNLTHEEQLAKVLRWAKEKMIG